MAVPDLTALTDDELSTTLANARDERIKRGRYGDIHDYLVHALTVAKAAGATKTQVTNFLSNIVNEVYTP